MLLQFDSVWVFLCCPCHHQTHVSNLLSNQPNSNIFPFLLLYFQLLDTILLLLYYIQIHSLYVDWHGVVVKIDIHKVIKKVHDGWSWNSTPKFDSQKIKLWNLLFSSQNHSRLRINFSDATVHLILNLADSTTDWKHEFDDGTGSTKNPNGIKL